jgi:hypothetical protein
MEAAGTAGSYRTASSTIIRSTVHPLRRPQSPLHSMILIPRNQLPQELVDRVEALEVPAIVQERLDDAMQMIDLLLGDLRTVREQLNSANDILHTTMVELANVRKKITKP